jgi:UDP-3-O-[3-hydroxymyristoyl] glucosamine N-acyltransferase
MDGSALSAQAVADLVGGRLTGDGTRRVVRVAPLDRAGPEDLSFLASPRYADAFRHSQAGAVLVAEELAWLEGQPATRIVVPDAARALATVLERMQPATVPPSGIDPSARLGPRVIIGREVSIGPYAVLGADVRLGDRVRIGAAAVLEDDVEIGDDTTIGPRVVCGAGTRIGRRCRVKAGAVLGGPGFGFVAEEAGLARIPHVGRCVIEDDVDIGSNTCIDRGSIDDTVIGAGTKIDNLVQIGHNVRIGRECLLMGQVGVAGSSRLGHRVILAGQVGVAGHLTVGDGARLAAQSGVSSDVPPGEDWGGYPARPNREWLRSTAVLYRLTPIARELEALVRERRNTRGEGGLDSA